MAKVQQPKKIVVVDDHPILRQGIVQMINDDPALSVVGEAQDVSEALQIIQETIPDLAVVDITLKDSNGIDLIKDIGIRWPKMPVLVFSMHDESFYAERVLRAGAKGYVMKREPVGVVLDGLRKVLEGHLALSENMVCRMLSQPKRARESGEGSPSDLLSDRELDVFRLLGEGLGTRQIAAKLHVATSTVETHRAGIKQKLGLDSATELVARAAQFVLDEQDQ